MPPYLIFTAPAMFIMLSKACIDIVKTAGTYRKLTPLVVVILITVVFLSMRYLLERLKPFETNETVAATGQKLKSLASGITTGKTVIFNTPYNIEMMFYSDCISYPFIPDTDQVDELLKQGFEIKILDSPDLPDSLRHNMNIEIVSL